MSGFYHKIGGLHWFRFGRLRIAICFKRSGAVREATKPRPKRDPDLPVVTYLGEPLHLTSKQLHMIATHAIEMELGI